MTIPLKRNSMTKKKLAITGAIVIVLHVSFCIYLTVFPKSYLATRSIGVLYMKYFLIGPFFSEDHIQSTAQTYIEYYTPGEQWQYCNNFGHHNLLRYQQYPWRIDKLKQSDFERGLFRKAYGKPNGTFEQ